MKKLLPLVIIAVFLALAVGIVLPPAPTAVAQQDENTVRPDFSTRWIYDSPEDTFTNSEVTGRKEWHANLGSGVPLAGLTLTLNSALNFDHIMKENLTTTGPPTYVWSFGDVPPGTNSVAYVGSSSPTPTPKEGPRPIGPVGAVVPVTFTPGFDASRSADNTEFSAPGTQTLTITLTPREGTERFYVFIDAPENELVNPVITSPTSGDGIELRQEGHQLLISPAGLALNATWSTTVTILVTPKVPEVEYIPVVSIFWKETIASGTTSGNSFSFPVTDMGTWTVSAEGSYEWDWTDELLRQVCWRPYPKPAAPVNQVKVTFSEEVSSWFGGDVDTFTNSELTGLRSFRIDDIANTDDETGAPVKDLRVTLDSDLVFDSVGGGDYLTRKMGPPTYEWFYGDLVEKSQYPGWSMNANVHFHYYATTIKPGFDASRSFDKTLFTAPDTQTLTITVTPREEWLEEFGSNISVLVVADEKNPVNPVITSYSATDAEEIKLTADKHRLGLYFIPVKLNTPLTITVTLLVTPKVPEVDYKPIVGIQPLRYSEADMGYTIGSSFSYTMPGVGTWTVSAEGDYAWNWGASHGVGPRVVFAGTPEPEVDPALFAGSGGPPPESATPMPTPSTRGGINLWVVIGIVAAGIAIIGLVAFFFVRRQRKQATESREAGQARKVGEAEERVPVFLEEPAKLVKAGKQLLKQPWLWAASAVLLVGLASLLVFLPRETPMYEDDFSHPASGWGRASSEDYEYGYEDGEYHILVKKSHWAPRNCNTGAGQFTDFALEIDARLVSGPNESSYGVVFRLQDVYNFYSLLVWGDGYYQVETWLNDKRTEQQGKTKSDFVNQGNNTNRLKVVCRGTQIEVYVNGHHLTTVTDDSFAGGYVGVIVQTAGANAHVAFDNIKVYSLD